MNAKARSPGAKWEGGGLSSAHPFYPVVWGTSKLKWPPRVELES